MDKTKKVQSVLSHQREPDLGSLAPNVQTTLAACTSGVADVALGRLLQLPAVLAEGAARARRVHGLPLLLRHHRLAPQSRVLQSERDNGSRSGCFVDISVEQQKQRVNFYSTGWTRMFFV